MNLGIQAFRYAAEPFFFSNAADKNSPALFAKINHYFVITGCIFLLAVSINLDILKFFIGENFRQGLTIVPILLLAYLFLGIYYNMSVWFKVKDKTYFGTWITLGGALITVGANFILIPYLGFTGSAWAALLCYFSMTAACFVTGQKHYPIPYKITQGLAYVALTVTIVYSINLLEISNQVLATAFHILVIVSFVGSIYFFERKNLRQEI